MATLVEEHFFLCHPSTYSYISILSQQPEYIPCFVFVLASLFFNFMSKCFLSHWMSLTIQLTQRKQKFHYTGFLILLVGYLYQTSAF